MQKQDKKDHSKNSGESTEAIKKVEHSGYPVTDPPHPLDDENIKKNFKSNARNTLQKQYDNSLDEIEKYPASVKKINKK